MSLPPGPCWAVTFRPTPRASTDPAVTRTLHVAANGLVAALKLARMWLARQEGGPFVIADCVDQPTFPPDQSDAVVIGDGWELTPVGVALPERPA